MTNVTTIARGAIASMCLIAAATACSGGSSGTGNSPVPNTQFCGNDTQYQLANPRTGATIAANNNTTVEIVAQDNNNQIFQSFKSFDLLFVPANNGGGSLQGSVSTGALAINGDRNAYAPYGSDYYYNGTISSPGLVSGTTYNVYVNAYTTNCVPVGPIGSLFAQ